MKIFLMGAFTIGFLGSSGFTATRAFAEPYSCLNASTPEKIENGKRLYGSNCLTCHGVEGNGLGIAGKYMIPKPRNFKDKFKKGDSIQEIFTTLTKGLDGTAMVGFPSIPDDDRCSLARYVLTFRNQKK